MILLFQSDFDLSEDLLNLLNDESLKSIGASTVAMPETLQVQTVEVDHQYCSRQHLKSINSDSGLSNDSSGTLSPPHSDNGLSDGSQSGMSPRSLSDENADSPLGGGVEDLMLTDLPFDTLDTTSFLTDDDFLSSVVDDASSNVTLDLGESDNPFFRIASKRRRRMLKSCLQMMRERTQEKYPVV